jgi:feruloyl esterase
VAFSAIARAQTTDDFKTKCTSFRPNIPNAKFEFAELVQSGTAANLPYADKTCGGPQKSEKVAQDVCRVTMYLETSARSGVQFEAWFPKTWNGRFLATGNGGIGGCTFLLFISRLQLTRHRCGLHGSSLYHTEWVRRCRFQQRT